jgi:uracil phosphoribosyltransferase
VVGGQLAAAAKPGAVSPLIRNWAADLGLLAPSTRCLALELPGIPGYLQRMSMTAPTTMPGTVHNLSRQPSLLNPILAEIRDKAVQQDRLRFRRNLERAGEIFAYEISKVLRYVERDVLTPLGTARVPVLAEQPVIASILRAGLPLHQGLLNYFDQADNTFISAYRKHEGDADHFEVEIEYLSSPSVEGRTVILCDPMLATGSSMVLAWQALLARGRPAHLHVVAVIASERGVRSTLDKLPENVTLWVGAIDPELTSRAYIVPGLGDAGDLAFGAKD